MIVNQVMICIKYLEKTIRHENEKNNGSCLITSRQYFFDRIFWCIARLRSAFLSFNDNCLSNSFEEKENFFSLLDKTLEMLDDFSEIHEENINEAEIRAELMMTSRRIREQVEVMISSNFMEVVLESDKIPIDCISKNIFTTAAKFSDEFSLTKSRKGNLSNQKMIIMELENEIFAIERTVSDALLRVVYEVFNELDKNPIGKLRNINLDTTRSDDDIQSFQLLMERLIHIGNFAVFFSADDWEDNSVIKSCLASIESLYPHLIKSLTDNTDPSLDILQMHFDEECEKFQQVIHKSIETKSFGRILMEKIETCCEGNRKTFNKNEFLNLLDFAKILLTHLQINSEVLKLTNDLSFPFNDLKLIFNECDAILSFKDDSPEFNKRILKRFNILKNSINKLLNAMNQNSSQSQNIHSEKSSKIKEESRQKSQNINKSVRMKNSLRMQVLRKNFKTAKDEIDGNETSLEVTQILNKLTILSTTLKF
jgi:hypothetical protein